MLEGTSPVLRREGSRKAPDLSDYNAHILDQLVAHQLPTWLESSLHIKQAGGLHRGKSDSLDAQRIAEYAYSFQDRMRLWQPPRQLLQELVILSALRQRLLLVWQQLQVPVNEQAAFVSTRLQKQLTRHCQASLKAINADLEQVNRQMDELIHQDQQLCELFKLMTSIPGIGPAVATEVILATDEFKNFAEPKKLACHAGVAPFEHSSGSSIRGRSRVNQHARKRLKFLFHLAAMSAIRVKPGRRSGRVTNLLSTESGRRQEQDVITKRGSQQAYPPNLCRRKAKAKI